MSPTTKTCRLALRAGVSALALAAVGGALMTTAAAEQPARTGVASVSHATADKGSANPLAGRPWAAYQGPGDDTWVAYEGASAEDQPLLAKIALQPRVRWYGAALDTSDVREAVAGQIEQAQNGNPETLVPIADFRMKPWEGDGGSACDSLPTAAQISDYKAWNREFAAGIGDAHVSVVMQPDGPIALCAPHGSKVYSHLIRYAVKAVARQPNASVYIDAGASDWFRNDPSKALQILLPAGVKYARGFALNSTHYASTEDQVRYGAAVTKALARKGLPNKHFVVNTAANGRPFDGFDYRGKDFDNARVCKSARQKLCVALGIPPTADVANPAWGLPATVARLARKHCDGYQWIGRPWLDRQAAPFDLKRALDLARNSPY